MGISGYQKVSGDINADTIYENGPHSIYLYANSNFQHYSSGIFDDESCPKFSYNHAVVNLDTAPAKDTGPSETHGPHHGENKDTSESSLDLTSVTVRNTPGTQKSKLLFLLIVKNYN